MILRLSKPYAVELIDLDAPHVAMRPNLKVIEFLLFFDRLSTTSNR